MNLSETPPLVPAANPRLSRAYLNAEPFALLGQRCEDCGKTLFPKTGVCPSCRSVNLRDQALPQEGILYSWSVVHVAPKPWPTPYTIGYVDLPGDLRVFAHIGGEPSALRVDMPVRLEPAEIGVDAQGQPRPFFRFVPLEVA